MKIAVGGMIASGKSTLAETLSKYYDIPLIKEYEDDDNIFSTLLSWLYTGKPNVEMLIQVFFLHNQYLRQNDIRSNSYIIDRDIIEHWLFANANLKHMPEVLSFYNNLFNTYLNKIGEPDLYIILDTSFKTFMERLRARGRASEVDNLDDKNMKYFKTLHETYTDKLRAQCIIHDIPYIVIDTNGKTAEEVFSETKNRIWTYNNSKSDISYVWENPEKLS